MTHPASEAQLVARRTPPWVHGIAAVVLVAASVGVYSSTFDDGFQNIDDNRFITRNERLRSLSPGAVADIFGHTHFGAYHPIHMLSYAIEYRLAGRWRPGLLHVDNVALHAANVLLVYLLLLSVPLSWEIALLGALIFGLHPTHVENIAWLSQRKDLLSLFFLLISFQLHVTSRRRGAGGHIAWLSLAAFILALLSKASALVLPGMLISYDLLLARIPWRKSLLRTLPFTVAAILAGLGMWAAQRGPDFPIGAFGGGGSRPALGDAVPAMLSVVPAYTRLFFFPVKLALFYPAPGVGASVPLLLVANVALVALFVVLRRRRWALLGLIWALAGLLPTLSLIPFGHYLADRYLYISSVGLALLVVLPLGVVSAGRRRRPVALAALAIVTVLLGVATVRRALEWESPRTLWEAQMLKVPNSIMARNNLASFHQRQGDWVRVLQLHMEVRTICQILGNREHDFYARASWKAGSALTRLEAPRDAREILLEARAMRPGWISPILEMARLEAAQGREKEALSLIEEARAGLGDTPGDRRLRSRFANTEGEILLLLGDAPGALSVLEKARREDPTDPDAPRLMGEAYLLTHQTDLAEEMFLVALREDERNLLNMARVLRDWREEGRAEASTLESILGRLTGTSAD